MFDRVAKPLARDEKPACDQFVDHRRRFEWCERHQALRLPLPDPDDDRWAAGSLGIDRDPGLGSVPSSQFVMRAVDGVDAQAEPRELIEGIGTMLHVHRKILNLAEEETMKVFVRINQARERIVKSPPYDPRWLRRLRSGPIAPKDAERFLFAQNGNIDRAPSL
uniref:Uncharacterized protein n=1 Tax=mine drainage metagenome TaxID=410659 RepID=E6PIX4_9ZZZZ